MIILQFLEGLLFQTGLLSNNVQEPTNLIVIECWGTVPQISMFGKFGVVDAAVLSPVWMITGSVGFAFVRPAHPGVCVSPRMYTCTVFVQPK